MSLEGDLQLVRDTLQADWPEELKQQAAASVRPVPKPFQTIIRDYCTLIARKSEKKWNAFCVVGGLSETISGDTHQVVIEKLYHSMFPGKKFLPSHGDMLRTCTEAMLDRDEVYFELFFHVANDGGE